MCGVRLPSGRELDGFWAVETRAYVKPGWYALCELAIKRKESASIDKVLTATSTSVSKFGNLQGSMRLQCSQTGTQ
jgi:hypothetical protein